VDARALGRAWLGAGPTDRALAALWRVASLASGLALIAPIMRVGRRQYRLGRLAERLEAVQDMALIPDALPAQLRWLQATIVLTIVGGALVPARYRTPAATAPVAALVLAALVRRASNRSEWTTSTWQLTAEIVVLLLAVVAAVVPTIVSRLVRRPDVSR
jgi:hypothetical protein